MVDKLAKTQLSPRTQVAKAMQETCRIYASAIHNRPCIPAFVRLHTTTTPRLLFRMPARRSGGSRGDRSVRFLLGAESQGSLHSVASTGGASDSLSWLATDDRLSREASMTSAARRGQSADGPASSQRSLDAHSVRGGWPRLVDRPQATPVRSSGMFTRDEEGSFRPYAPAVRTRSLVMPAGEATGLCHNATGML